MALKDAEQAAAAPPVTMTPPPPPPPAAAKTELALAIDDINAARNLLELSAVYDKWAPRFDDWTRRDISIFEAAYQTKQAQF